MKSMMVYSLMLFLISFIFLWLSFLMYLNYLIYIFEWDIYFFNSMKFSMILYFDYISMQFLWVVMLISSMVMMYSIEYLSNEKFLDRFKYLLLMFIFSMILMIISPSILSILLGWDGLGLISYCLIIYYQSMNAFNSGMLTILCNRIGDIGLLMLICFCSCYGSWNLMLYFMDNFMMMLMLLAVFSKSAQMPFSFWLPAAMMAPTPISSLVHSSTLVTAGVYLLFRYNYLFLMSVNFFILYISIFTMFMAGLIANFEFDFKKIIALSTLSQLGFMMSILSMGFYELAFFHLIIHALFKSTMFMCAGNLIHLNLNNQDIRFYGNMLNLFPLSSLILIGCLLNLCGIPYMSGFFSKDMIIEYFFNLKLNYFMLFMFYLSMIFTISYSIRLIYWLFLNKNNNLNYFYLNIDSIMSFCLILMFIFMLFSGNILFNLLYKYYMMMVYTFDKIMILKFYFFSFYLSMLFIKMDQMFLNSFMFFLSSMFFLSYFLKNFFFNLFMYMYLYENVVEKGWFESLMGMFMLKFVNYFMLNYFKIINIIMLMLMYLFLFLLLI